MMDTISNPCSNEILISEFSWDPSELMHLMKACVAEGHRIIPRLLQEIEDGSNCYNKTGEALFVAINQTSGLIVGTGGLNIDPYVDEPSLGRLRRFYVDPSARKQAIGYLLATRALMAADGHFDFVRLKTSNPIAAKFYEKIGFIRTDLDQNESHRIKITQSQ